MNGKEVNEPGPECAVVFQNHSLLPWLTAYENVELGVKQAFKGKKNKTEMREWIEHNLKLVHMDHAMNKRPDEISGGMKQRVGIARALLNYALLRAPAQAQQNLNHIKIATLYSKNHAAPNEDYQQEPPA